MVDLVVVVGVVLSLAFLVEEEVDFLVEVERGGQGELSFMSSSSDSAVKSMVLSCVEERGEKGLARGGDEEEGGKVEKGGVEGDWGEVEVEGGVERVVVGVVMESVVGLSVLV